MAQKATQPALKLPVGVMSRADIGRLLRELNSLDSFLEASEARQPGTALQLPRTGKLLEELLQLNDLNALQEDDRQKAKAVLERLRTDAPQLHFSFSTDPSPLFLKRLMTWLRDNIHPQLLIQVGLRPTIGAGVTVRSTNKYFDFSLHQQFKQHSHELHRALQGNGPAQPAPQEAAQR